MGKKKDKVPAPGKFPKTKKVEKECKGKWATWLKTKTTVDFLPGRMVEWDGAMVLAKALEKNQTVTSIDFSHNNIRDDGLKYLAQALKVNSTIRVLNVSCNAISDAGGLSLASALMTNRSLTDLNLLGNDFTCITAQAFGNVLRVNFDICRINFSWNNIGHRGARALSTAMERHQIFTVNLGGQGELGDEGVQHICDSWKKWGNKEVHTSLALWQNDIGKYGAEYIADLLQGNEFVTDLNLSWNSLGSEGVLKISQGLVAGKTALKVINLSHNIVGNTGAKEFAKVVETSFPTLERVNLSSNDIGDAGGVALAQALAKNASLKHLDLSYNKLGHEAVTAFAEAIIANKTLVALQLQRNGFSDDMKTTLSEAMRNSESNQRDARSPVPVQMRVNYGAADDDNPYTDYFQKVAGGDDR